MKKLILFLLLSIPILGQSAFEQYSVNGGFGLNDSLHTVWIDTLAAGAGDDDTLAVSSLWKYIPLNYAYEWGTIAIEDTGTTYDDSLVVEQGIVIYTGSSSHPVKSDTTWHQISLRDSLWGLIASPSVDDASIHAYTIYCPLMDVIRIRETNVQAVNNRVTYIRGVFKRLVGR